MKIAMCIRWWGEGHRRVKVGVANRTRRIQDIKRDRKSKTKRVQSYVKWPGMSHFLENPISRVVSHIFAVWQKINTHGFSKSSSPCCSEAATGLARGGSKVPKYIQHKQKLSRIIWCGAVKLYISRIAREDDTKPIFTWNHRNVF